MASSLHKRITDTTSRSAQVQPRIHIHTYMRCGRAARRSSVLMSKGKIRCSLCPDSCRAIVPCEIVPGQTQPLLHEISYKVQGNDQLGKGRSQQREHAAAGGELDES